MHEPRYLPVSGLLLAGSLFVGSAMLAENVAAQRRGKSQEQLKEQRAEKLAKPFIKYANWILDYDEARKTAKAQNKFLLTYFTRSYSP